MEQVSSVLEGLYSAFLLRDLAYLCLGAVPVFYAARWGFPGAKDFLDRYPKITVVTFLALSYISGIAVYQCAVVVGVVRLYPPGQFVEQQAEAVAALTRIQASAGGVVPKYVERIIYLKQMTGAVGLALALLALLHLLDGFRERRSTVRVRLAIGVLLLSVSFGVLYTNWSKADVQAKLLEKLDKDCAITGR